MNRLMLLGGSRYLLPVIEAAHKLGCYVITCDYLPDNIAHRYSDEYCNVSIIEKELVLEAARNLKIDGIMSFACDPGVVTAAYVAEKMGLPSCGPYESVCILQNKGKFRQFLTKNGFHVPTAKGFSSIEDAIRSANIFHWPVIVKPVDSAGSKGVTRVDDLSQLEQSIRYALSFSHCNEFIIEDFITQQGCSSDSDCFSVDGELKFASFSAQRFDSNADNPYTPSAYSWPSTIPDSALRELRSEIQRLLRLLNMKTSLYNVETRVSKEGIPYIMEVSPRGGGNRISELLKMASGNDMIANAVRAALGEPVEDFAGDPSYEGHWAMIALHTNQEGIFEELWTDPEFEKNNIVEKDLWVKKGDEVYEFTGANQTIGTLVLRFDTEKMLQEFLMQQNRYFKVILMNPTKS